MPTFYEFKKTTSDRSIYINSSYIVIVSPGSDLGTTTLELAGQRTFAVRGEIKNIMSVINGLD